MSRKTCIISYVSAVAVSVVISVSVVKCCMKDHLQKVLMEKPEIVKEALEQAMINEQEAQMKAMVEKVKANRKALEEDPTTPVMGNPDGDITIVEFFDYNCGYCKMMYPKVMKFLEEDGNVRWVLKDMPSLGPTSDLAARAGLAANEQGKYAEMHADMITHKGSLTEENIVEYAKKAGLDMEKFNADRKDKKFDAVLRKNRALANRFGFRGIPNFIIGDFISNGAMMNNELEEAVIAIREGK